MSSKDTSHSAGQRPGDTEPLDMSQLLREYEVNRAHPQQELSSINTSSSDADFVRLHPLNPPAKNAFHEVATRVLIDQDWYPNAQEYLFIGPPEGEMEGETELLEDSLDSDTEGQKSKLRTGYFRANLVTAPPLGLGWVLGAGREELGTDLGGVHFVVTLNRKRDKVRGRHMQFVFHPQSKAFMIRVTGPRKMVVLGTEDVTECERYIYQQSMSLSVGNLQYKVESRNPPGFGDLLNQLFIENGYSKGEDKRNLAPTPSPLSHENHGYIFTTSAGAGTFGHVFQCFNKRTGDAYAAKRILSKQTTDAEIQNEISILKALGEHVCMGRKLRSDNIADDSQDNICSLVEAAGNEEEDRSQLRDVYLILDPLATDVRFLSFMQFCSDSDRIRAYHQVCRAVAHVHSRGIIHRDIKPDNILVATEDPLRMVLTDFGHSTTDTRSRDHRRGTIYYLSPEILDIKNGIRTGPGWTTKSDIFSLGLVAYESFHGATRRPQQLDVATHERIMQSLRSSRPVNNIISLMLSWDPRKRPTMESVLSKPFWRDAAPDPQIPAEATRKRRNSLD
jgi:hypothetical protein